MDAVILEKLDVKPFRFPPNFGRPDPHYQGWRKQFRKPIVVEVGCGVGYHPIQWASKNPGQGIVALERTKNKFERFQSRMDNHLGLENLYMENVDALYWLPENLVPGEVAKYFFLYPNPYPKEKQANKRWHRNPLMEFIINTLIPGGTIEIATNEEWLHREALHYFKHFWNLNVLENRSIGQDTASEHRTHFEKKYLESGQTCWNLVVQKSLSTQAIFKGPK